MLILFLMTGIILFGILRWIMHRRRIHQDIFMLEEHHNTCRSVWVYQTSHHRIMSFVKPLYRPNLSMDLKNSVRQTMMDLHDPYALLFRCHHVMIYALLLLHQEPERILILGLGGGTLTKAFAHLLPEAHIDTVEIDADIVRMAHRHFNLPENDHRIQTHIEDGLDFIEKQPDQSYDMIIVDLFDTNGIPEPFLQEKTIQKIKKISRGLVIHNALCIHTPENPMVPVYQVVFPHCLTFKIDHDQMILIGASTPFPNEEEIALQSRRWEKRLQTYHLDRLLMLREIRKALIASKLVKKDLNLE